MAVLELAGISKRFGAIEALAGVDLALNEGEVLGLMGDNGAGKSTLVKIIAGTTRQAKARYGWTARSFNFASPGEARGAGIELVHQDLALCDNLPAALNVFLGREWCARSARSGFLTDRHVRPRRRTVCRAEIRNPTARSCVVDVRGSAPGRCDRPHRLTDPKIVLLDEPTAAISVRQVGEVLEMIRNLRETGHAIILISHRMPDVFAVADRVAVLRRGQKVADKPIAETSPEEVTGLITGAIEVA